MIILKKLVVQLTTVEPKRLGSSFSPVREGSRISRVSCHFLIDSDTDTGIVHLNWPQKKRPVAKRTICLHYRLFAWWTASLSQNAIHVLPTTTFSHYLVITSFCFHNELTAVPNSAAHKVQIPVTSKTVDQNLRIFCPLQAIVLKGISVMKEGSQPCE